MIALGGSLAFGVLLSMPAIGIAWGSESGAPESLPAIQPLCDRCPTMVRIEGGDFLMGSPNDEPQSFENEGPQHPVSVRTFEISRTEITFDQWNFCVERGGCSHRPGDRGWGQGDRPVIDVHRADVQEYIDWFSEFTGDSYRLPSEAEWEYAARAGTTGRFNTGDCIDSGQANFKASQPAEGCAAGEYRRQTLPVGSFEPNAFGLFDMHGNVREWVADCWNERYEGASVSGEPWMSGDCSQGVVRGGAWVYTGDELRSAHRSRLRRQQRDNYTGFRIARSLGLWERCPLPEDLNASTLRIYFPLGSEFVALLPSALVEEDCVQRDLLRARLDDDNAAAVRAVLSESPMGPALIALVFSPWQAHTVVETMTRVRAVDSAALWELVIPEIFQLPDLDPADFPTLAGLAPSDPTLALAYLQNFARRTRGAVWFRASSDLIKEAPRVVVERDPDEAELEVDLAALEGWLDRQSSEFLDAFIARLDRENRAGLPALVSPESLTEEGYLRVYRSALEESVSVPENWRQHFLDNLSEWIVQALPAALTGPELWSETALRQLDSGGPNLALIAMILEQLPMDDLELAMERMAASSATGVQRMGLLIGLLRGPSADRLDRVLAEVMEAETLALVIRPQGFWGVLSAVVQDDPESSGLQSVLAASACEDIDVLMERFGRAYPEAAPPALLAARAEACAR
ncbi:formylglycine-generating enzyme family protein [Wenzhouxiangella marina]|nr:formylglycine-generating enzyme family protein [Wenzhouxiangella marina]MBB6086787.1 formylglycine-generating enzyme required for sulfatase activity [Wenzhouxiangella marina]